MFANACTARWREFQNRELVPLRLTAGRCTLDAEIVVRIHEGEPTQGLAGEERSLIRIDSRDRHPDLRPSASAESSAGTTADASTHEAERSLFMRASLKEEHRAVAEERE